MGWSSCQLHGGVTGAILGSNAVLVANSYSMHADKII